MYASEFAAINIMMRKFTQMEMNADIQFKLSAILFKRRKDDYEQRLLVKAGTMY